MQKIPLLAFGNSLSIFLAFTFAFCVVWGFAFPEGLVFPVQHADSPLLGWHSWSSFLLRLAGSYGSGWYTAIIFVPLYNYFAAESL